MSEVSIKPTILPVETCESFMLEMTHHCSSLQYVHRSAMSSSKLNAFMFLLVC